MEEADVQRALTERLVTMESPIAIVGMSCRFAGDVDNPEKLWELLAEGRSAWSEIPKSRFNVDGVYHPNFEKLDGVSWCWEIGLDEEDMG